MVPTQALLTAMAAFADPTPTPALLPPDDPPLAAHGELMRFAHPVLTSPYMPPSRPPAHPTEQPKRGGGGGRGGSGGGGGSGQSMAATRGASGSLGQTLPPGWTQNPQTESPNPTVLPNPNDPPPDPTLPPDDLLAPPTGAPTGSGGTSAVVPDELSPLPDSPVQTPEPGTVILFVVGASAGGGAVVRKWIRRKKG